MPDHVTHQFIVDTTVSERRLDQAVAAKIPDCSRSLAAILIRRGLVTLDGATVKPGQRVRSGDAVVVRIEAQTENICAPESLPVDILYEDQDVMVINKAPGIVVHPGAGNRCGTLVNGLLHLRPALASLGAAGRPGIVHRLDKDTSGALIVAKSLRALSDLGDQFKRRTVEKRYVALVLGQMKEESGEIRQPIGRHRVQRQKMAVQGSRLREAETHWRVKAQLAGSSLLEVRIRTGRTHQIRVHLAAIAHPVLGDRVYGNRGVERQRLLRAIGCPAVDLPEVPRQMLHAAYIAIRHPATGAPLTVEAPLPFDFRFWRQRLGGGSNSPAKTEMERLFTQ